jgi:hypothetical protein
MKDFRGFLKDRMDNRLDSIDTIFNSKTSNQLSDLNKDYSKAAEVYRLAHGKLAAQNANNMFSITDKGFGGAGALGGALIGEEHGGLEGAVKGGLLGLGAGAASKAARTYGTPALMSGAQAGANITRPFSPAINAASTAGQGLLSNPYVNSMEATRLGKEIKHGRPK